MKTKACSKCSKIKGLTEFYIDKRRPFGVGSWCKVCMNRKRAIYYQKNKEQVLEQKREYYQDNKEQRNEWLRNKRKTDINFKIKCNLVRRMRKAVNGTPKAGRTFDLIGCTPDELKAHLESQFTEGMTWDNVLNGEIHIDHIVPCSIFDFTDIEQQRR